MRYIVVCVVEEELQSVFMKQRERLQQLAPVKASMLPFHITLVPPFQEETMLALLQAWLDGQVRPAFAYQVEGFAHFDKHVLYVPVTPSAQMTRFVKELYEAIAFTPQPNPPVFHITLVSKKVEPAFDLLWEALCACTPVQTQGRCTQLCIYGWQ
ncbi:MAG: 2'-5' RNA ligase family protein, partial [Erysipelotrichaceae bacterium]